MLEGKRSLSVKRAVFLAEWAFLDGKLDYENDYCKEVDRIADYIKKIIAINHFENYKTAKQFSLCNFFFSRVMGIISCLIPTTSTRNTQKAIGIIN